MKEVESNYVDSYFCLVKTLSLDILIAFLQQEITWSNKRNFGEIQHNQNW